MYRKLIAVFLVGTSLSACASDIPAQPPTAPVAQAPHVPHVTPLTDIPSCMALHDKLPDFYEEPPLALLANNNTATPAEAVALMQCHQQGIVPQRAAFVEMLSHILPGAEAIASAAFPAQDQATLRVVRREMTWGQYAADYSNRSHQTIAAVMAYKQQVGQANAAADAAAKREEDAEQAARIQAGAAAIQQLGSQIYNASTPNYYPPPPVMQPPPIPQQTQCHWIGSTLNCNTF